LTPRRFIAAPFFEPPTEDLRYLPEGPRLLRNYPGGESLLGWVSIQYAADRPDGSLNVLDLASRSNRAFPLPGRPGFFAETTRPGCVLIGLERSLVYFDLLAGRLLPEPQFPVTADTRVIINDGLAVEGGVFFGTKDLKFRRPIAALYFFDAAARRIHTLLDGQTCSNGKYLLNDPHGPTLIDIDTAPRNLRRYRLDAACKRVLESSLVLPPDALPAFPDGMRPAPDGESVIVAFYNNGAVSDGVARQIRLADGATLCEWRVPGSPRVTCPELVEIDGEVKLLLATAVEGMPEETRRIAPHAGFLFLAGTPFRTPPPPPPLVPL